MVMGNMFLGVPRFCLENIVSVARVGLQSTLLIESSHCIGFCVVSKSFVTSCFYESESVFAFRGTYPFGVTNESTIENFKKIHQNEGFQFNR